MPTGDQWQFWIDRGGTFTDVVAQEPGGHLSSFKYLSVNPERYDDAAVYAMRDILSVDEAAPFPDQKVAAIKMGTTVATNALLERQGSKTLLLITSGFKDILLIGQQHRQGLFDLKPSRPNPLYSAVVEVSERIHANGAVETPIDLAQLELDLKHAQQSGFDSIAIAFAHGYRHPKHETTAAALAEQVGFQQISVSHKVSPLMKLVPRGDTTVADAYLTPVLKHYVSQVRANTGRSPLYFMQSNGGLVAASAFEGKDAVLSGPAGGIVGAVRAAEREGITRILGFDMGGTSTDVSHYAGAFERVTDTNVAGVRMTIPMMDIHTVAAGGGSICRFENGRFQVGPQSAGAHPGPACYGLGGPITITDCNVMVGKIQPDLFPAVFGPDGKQPLNAKASMSGFEQIKAAIRSQTGREMSNEEIAEGFLAVAVEHMARAIKRVSVERGHNVKNYALLTFGGAGGQHACLVADALGMEKALIPPFAGVLSALGMGMADQRAIAEKAVEVSSHETNVVMAAINDVINKAKQQLQVQGVALDEIEVKSSLKVKYEGTDTTLPLQFNGLGNLRNEFEIAHMQQFGFVEADTPLVIEAVEAEAIARLHSEIQSLENSGSQQSRQADIPVYTVGKKLTASVVHRKDLAIGSPLNGPAIIIEDGSTTVVEPDWQAETTANGSLLLHRTKERMQAEIEHETADPIMLEIFNNLFMSVAEEMGGVLAKTAHSVNVKERLDFSCAVFDEQSRLIANAPHMPVHLGSMGESVGAIAEARRGTMKPGDVFMVNDPTAGGTHLPDITVVTPIFLDGSSEPDFFVASRGHHADVGGTTPGSMPPDSKTLSDEGISFINFQLVDDGSFLTDQVVQALCDSAHPARNPAQNIADLKAQVAANARGAMLVKNLVSYYGIATVSRYMEFVRQNAAEAVRAVIGRLTAGRYEYKMDCGATINVSLQPRPEEGRLTVDFTGSSEQLSNNYNAPYAVVKAAVLYVFRVLAGGDIPLNSGCLEPIDIIMPDGSMMNPGENAAVVAGNVETSQAITNALFLATGELAASQGTMNNFTFGNDTYQYYETIAGGTGAGQSFDGTDAIHSHMTNSRLTDIEVLEWRYPVLVREFGVRAGSGGVGAHQGGSGVVREFEFLEPMEISLLANHYLSGPPGFAGGRGGKPGEASILRTDGTLDKLNYADKSVLNTGDRIRIETPGGGGYGSET
ncbi:MAG: hydantoinase B/oxoprolinase family protein [Kordiimonadaceae bacterium]|nr:hydantoinase B/oxoprolinase family protein [Kordiimonadaceae bacterium]MBO6569176.1 hydantoinase B/oxoprolinase family protein [Kordiimonadaceae bacterium]MBO6964652.1 hydantoinase B/oxoprolinase family protein [Kordiimonadaceae bacterium]